MQRDLIRVLVAIAFSENVFQCPEVVSMLHQAPVPRLVDVGELIPQRQRNPHRPDPDA